MRTTTIGQVLQRGGLMALAAVTLASLVLTSRQVHAADARRDLERADAYVEMLFDRSGLPGMALAVVEGDGIVYARGFGTASDRGVPITPETLFIIGSTTKSMTALAVLQLAEQGKLQLDDPVRRHLSGFLTGDAAANVITLRMLLNQTSGLSHEAGDQPMFEAGDTSIQAIRNWSLRLAPGALNRPPGSSYEYSNANFVVLGAVIEAASGQSYRDYMRDRIFAPLGMTHTYASLADVPRNTMAQGHRQFLAANAAGDVPYAPAFVPAGFVISSASDIAKYLAAQLPNSATASRLGISPRSIELWHTGVAAMDPAGKGRYAMGWAVDTFNGLPVVYHSGDTGVFASEFTLDLANRRAVVLLANGSHWLTSPYVQEISSGVVNMLAGRSPRDDSGIHTMAFRIYALVLALPILQLIALIVSIRTGRPRSTIGRVIVIVLHTAVATALLYGLPRMVFGIPLTELIISVPDMGYAALLSGTAAVAASWYALRGSAAGA